ncbi:MAG: hypothetical protein OEW06_13640, partial [Gemmatimonadota bacterium]|nr:hypothetical protein [Gemmatimonadota bacterium]
MKPMIHRIFHVGLVALGLSLMVSCGDGDKVTGTGTPHFDAGASLAQLGGDEFLGMFPEREMQVLDGGRAFDGGDPPAEIRFNDA